MMKIISKGHIYKQTKCNICDCVFQFEEEDIEEKEDVRDNHGCPCATDFKLTCPYCHRKITVRDVCDVKSV